MGVKGVIFTDEHKRKIGLAHKGKTVSDVQKEKQRLKMIGRIPWNKGKTGLQKMSEDEKEKRRTRMLGENNHNYGTTMPKERRIKVSQSRKGKCMREQNPAWNGGTSWGNYCPKFNEPFKERVRERFGRKCILCGKTEYDNGEKLSVHHVDYDKHVCCNGSPPLFVPLCREHHLKTNNNRMYWAQLFYEIIYIQYGGKCFYSIEEFATICESKKRLNELGAGGYPPAAIADEVSTS